MKLSTTEDHLLMAEEVFNPLCLRTKDGFDLAVCMRDDGYEIAVGMAKDKSKDIKRYRVTPGGIEELFGSISMHVQAKHRVDEVLGSGIYNCPFCREAWLQVKCRYCGGCGVKVTFADGLK